MPPSSVLIFFDMTLTPPRSTLFPYTTLFRSTAIIQAASGLLPTDDDLKKEGQDLLATVGGLKAQAENGSPSEDRKSTRLNSSHLGISYAVFCLKKKKKK